MEAEQYIKATEMNVLLGELLQNFSYSSQKL